MARQKLTQVDEILQDNQAQAAVMLASGATDTAAAQAAGVTRQTVWEWRQAPAFQAALNRERAALRQAWQDEAQALNSEALAVMRAALGSEDAAVRFRAACFVLAKSGLLNGELPTIGAQSATMVSLSTWGL